MKKSQIPATSNCKMAYAISFVVRWGVNFSATNTKIVVNSTERQLQKFGVDAVIAECCTTYKRNIFLDQYGKEVVRW